MRLLRRCTPRKDRITCNDRMIRKDRVLRKDLASSV